MSLLFVSMQKATVFNFYALADCHNPHMRGAFLRLYRPDKQTEQITTFRGLPQTCMQPPAATCDAILALDTHLGCCIAYVAAGHNRTYVTPSVPHNARTLLRFRGDELSAHDSLSPHFRLPAR
eukprot:6189742-Pleurochrysis_carterae.AAC.1